MSACHRCLPLPLTRRALLTVGLLAALLRAEPARAAPAVVVASPVVDRIDDCLATVSVRVRLNSLRPGTRYAVGGTLLELDTAPENADVCGEFPPRIFVAAPGGAAAELLAQRVSAAQIGLWRGVGPASDEEESADLVELAAEAWLRDLDAGEDLGRWQSAPRVLVSRAVRELPGNERIDPADLMFPRRQQHPGDTLLFRPRC